MITPQTGARRQCMPQRIAMCGSQQRKKGIWPACGSRSSKVTPKEEPKAAKRLSCNRPNPISVKPDRVAVKLVISR